MTNQDSKEIFRKKMENENTTYLKRILEIHNTYEWSEDELAIVADILRSRGENNPDSLPPQPVPIPTQPAPLPRQPERPTWLRGFLLVAFFGLGFLFIYYNGIYQSAQAQYQRLASKGRVVSATITGLKPYLPPGSDEFTTYWVEYSFIFGVNGEIKGISNWQKIPDPVYDTLKVGQTIEVAYDVADPTNAAINPAKWSSIYINRLLILALAVGVGVLAYLVYLYFRTRQWKSVMATRLGKSSLRE